MAQIGNTVSDNNDIAPGCLGTSCVSGSAVLFVFGSGAGTVPGGG